MHIENSEDPIGFLVAKTKALPNTSVRTLIAIAGPPASGKSTLSANLVAALYAQGLPAVLIPMDGFHLDNPILTDMGMLKRKGSPETFDGDGFINAIQRLKSESELYLPSFDRSKDLSVAGSVAVTGDHKFAVVEGNYLCFDEAPWRQLSGLWDYSVFLDVAAETIKQRLVQRWLDYGFSTADALAKVQGNDLPNAERILAAASGCDVVLRVPDQAALRTEPS